jgi:hypothetical protein
VIFVKDSVLLSSNLMVMLRIVWRSRAIRAGVLWTILLNPGNVQALTWDLGLSVPYFSGRMAQFLPLSLEVGATSIKGYGLGYTLLTSGNHELLKPQQETTASQEYESQLTLQSGTLEGHYRFEQYVHRWDLGVMRQATRYEVAQKQTALNTSISTEQKTSLDVVYWGPFLRYSNTWVGYDTQDAYYAVQLAWLSRRATLTETPLTFSETSDTVLQAQQRKYQQFLVEQNPESSVLLAFTFGWRL